jgi:hypothetical protein
MSELVNVLFPLGSGEEEVGKKGLISAGEEQDSQGVDVATEFLL